MATGFLGRHVAAGGRSRLFGGSATIAVLMIRRAANEEASGSPCAHLDGAMALLFPELLFECSGSRNRSCSDLRSGRRECGEDTRF